MRTSSRLARRLTRRAFLAAGASVAAVGLGRTSPLGIPVGLQLYTVRAELESDFEGTLNRVASIGIREVELILLPGHKPAEVRRALANVGLNPISVHLGGDALLKDAQQQIDIAAELGVAYLICPEPLTSPAARRRSEFAAADAAAGHGKFLAKLTLEDWRWNAAMFNAVGAQAHKSGIQFGYHNHSAEFRRFGTGTAYDELIRHTDPGYVTFEMDCGWVESSRTSAAAYLCSYPGRFQLLHIKDIKRRAPVGVELEVASTEVGRGIIDWRSIFAAARRAGLKHYFIEQEPPFEHPPLESVRMSYEWLRRLG